MAQSPSDAVASETATGYLESWRSLASMIVRGRSLSGNERNCAFLNLGPGEEGTLQAFGDVSAASALDLIDDSRALAATDWDLDGDLDLWLTNREAPRVRLLRNNSSALGPPTGWVSFALQGTTTNRDAIGAVLRFDLDGRVHTRSLRAGDGFLSQSGKRVHFGLGVIDEGSAPAGRLTVHWPGGGTETIEGVAVNAAYRLVEGSGSLTKLPAPRTPIDLRPVDPPPADTTDKARIVLTERIDAPVIEYVDFQGELRKFEPEQRKGPTLINLWSSDCVPCVLELRDFKKEHAAIKEAGVEIIALTTEAVSEAGSKPDISGAKALVASGGFPFQMGAADTRALRLLTVLHNQAIVLERPLPLPSSFLFDRHGRLAVIYKGPVSSAALLEDLALLEAAPAAVVASAFPSPSRGGYELFPITLLHFAKAYQDGGYLDDARKVVREILAARPSGNAAADAVNKARTWYYLGTLEQGARNWSAAAEAYARAIEFSPGQPLLEIPRGVVLWQSGKQEDANAAFQRAATAGEANPQVLEALGKAHLQIERPSEAINYLERARAGNPGDTGLALTLALAHEKAGDSGAALALYRSVLDQNPTSGDALNNLAWLLATSPDEGFRNGNEALQLATKVNEASGFRNPATLDTLAAALAETGAFDKAVETIDQAIAIARATGQSRLIVKLAEKRARYVSNQPFRSE